MATLSTKKGMEPRRNKRAHIIKKSREKNSMETCSKLLHMVIAKKNRVSVFQITLTRKVPKNNLVEPQLSTDSKMTCSRMNNNLAQWRPRAIQASQQKVQTSKSNKNSKTSKKRIATKFLVSTAMARTKIHLCSSKWPKSHLAQCQTHQIYKKAWTSYFRRPNSNSRV